MKFQREPLCDVFEEMLPLCELHYKEIAHFKDIPLNPSKEQYLKIEDSGALRVFTARDESNEIVGYGVYFVKHNIRYPSSLQAVQDVLFIHPKKRGFGMKFIAWCDEQLRNEGVQVVYHHVKANRNFGPLLERLDYTLVDLIYARRLD